MQKHLGLNWDLSISGQCTTVPTTQLRHATVSTIYDQIKQLSVQVASLGHDKGVQKVMDIYTMGWSLS